MDIKCKYEQLVPIHKLTPNPKNPNKHGDRQIELLAKIIDNTGFRHPIIVSKRSGFVVAGHGRLMAAEKLKMEQVPVDYQDFKDEAEEYSFVVADNKIAELAEHDDLMMIDTIKELELKDFELLGMSEFKMPNIDEIPEVKNTGAELNIDAFDNFQHQCPKCGFEWNDDGSDNA